jgi:O-antigen biosynthesis protein
VKIFSSFQKSGVAASGRTDAAQAVPVGRGDVQGTPLARGRGDFAKHQIKVDLAFRFARSVIVAGWRTGSFEPGLVADSGELDVRHVSVSRPDVAKHFELEGDDSLGFVLIADAPADAAVSLAWEDGSGSVTLSQPLKFSSSASSGIGDLKSMGPAMGLLALAEEPHSKRWANLIACAPVATTPCPTARGHLEGAAVCELTREGLIVGWVVSAPGTVVWLEDHKGRTFSLDSALRRFRQDVHDAMGHEFGHASREAGFMVRLRGFQSGSRLQLKAVAETGVHVLAEITSSTLPVDPVAAARWLFATGVPLQEMQRRVPVIDEPVLGALIEQRQAIWDALPVQRRDLGELPASPTVSVIVPLYGRSDFVEHQLIEFSADPWFRAHAELVYVLDDPKLTESFPAQAEAMHRLYKLPFRWVWGSVNRGFSGANNLGMRNSSAPTIVFLNSDAFPQSPGWLQPLVDVLQTHPRIGAVGPRLVFADGSIQHAGMEFARRNELGVWINHHPHVGLDPQLDPRRELTVVPAVTGACIAVRRGQLEKFGGWDTGYLIGDFEDSDLCLRLRAEGFDIGYLPTVQLTHLERQSFKLLGQDEFRTRVVIYNAVRHQSRWHEVMAQPVVTMAG